MSGSRVAEATDGGAGGEVVILAPQGRISPHHPSVWQPPATEAAGPSPTREPRLAPVIPLHTKKAG